VDGAQRLQEQFGFGYDLAREILCDKINGQRRTIFVIARLKTFEEFISGA